MKTRSFTATVEGKEVEFVVRSPSVQDQKEGTKVYNTAFSEALKSKAVVRAKLDDLLVDQGLWDDSKQMKFATLQAQILEGERKLAKGGISLSEAKEEALKMKKLRSDLRDLISVKTSLDTHTAEGQADNARFNYLVSVCTVYKDNNKPYFKSYEDYNNRSGDIVALLGAQNLAGMLYGVDSDYEDKLPENKFLKQYKFVDSKLRLINKEGKLVDSEGRLIDENGRFINEKGEFIDKDGNLVDLEGDYVVEFTPFLDDEGNPVVLEDSSENKDGTESAKESTENVETKSEPVTESVPA
jgi:hypothetical protein